MTVKTFRKRPVEVQAIQWDGRNFAEVSDFAAGQFRRREPTEGGEQDMRAEVYDVLHDSWVTVFPGNWVVRGVKGEFYPIVPEVLADTYEPVDPENDAPAGADSRVVFEMFYRETKAALDSVMADLRKRGMLQ